MLSPGYKKKQKTFSTLNTKLVFLAVNLPHTERPPTVPVSVFFFLPALCDIYIYSCTWKNFRLPVSAPPLMSSDLDRWLEEATRPKINPFLT